MLKGFKEFVFRGNVVDLAVGVVIGSAFGGVVNSLVADLLTPIISAIAQLPDFSELSLDINNVSIGYGNFLNSIISFLLVALAIYFFVIIPMQRVIKRFTKNMDPQTRACMECCSEIPLAARRCKHCGQVVGA